MNGLRDLAATVVSGLAPLVEPCPTPPPPPAWHGPAESHPLGPAVLAAFPGSRIVNVTRRPAGSFSFQPPQA